MRGVISNQLSVISVASAALLAGCGCPPTDEEEPSLTVEQILAEKHEYDLLTPEHVPMPFSSFAPCRELASDGQPARAEENLNPHASASILVSMSSAAASSFRESATPYPVGSVILKLKHLWADTFKKSEVGDIGGMVKRSAGYDPVHGDWEYFYVKNNKVTVAGKLANCIDCHTNASDRDYVFGTWANTPAKTDH